MRIAELVWSKGESLFEVHLDETGDDLTQDGCLDHPPTDDEIAGLLPSWWVCLGCGTRIDDSQADMIVDHVRGCDLVDGAGQPVRPERHPAA
ncbi:hypothetical protein [Micromonospora aurantiaca (nom. illeg.)]|uniref:hypothetical protein n=1 Tax=Micromonospora aurantiaca (nom. illeg.) TaxID=47850 RepID=UPI00340DC9DD